MIGHPIGGVVSQVVLWCEQVNVHYSAWLRALASMEGLSVKVVASMEVSPERKQLGWTPASIAPAEAMIVSSPRGLADALASCEADAVHIVEGIRGTSIARLALKMLVAGGCRVGIISERGDNRGVRGLVRRLLYTTHLRRLRGKIDFVLAMGDSGVKWYTSCGAPGNRVFPFAYVAGAPALSGRSKRMWGSENLFRIVYLGQCVERKGIQDLLEALKKIDHGRVSLSVIGDGYLRSRLEATVGRSMSLRDRVEFVGAMPYCEAVASISDFDLLVLPSRFDGWGVVVNEALMQGVPVVCSDECGAKDLLAESWRGGVFRAGSAQSLANELASRVRFGRPSSGQREQLKEWGRRIDGESIAKYLMSILGHVYAAWDEADPPWMG